MATVLNAIQKEINKINANIQYYERVFGKNSDVTSNYIESLYTGETKKYFHTTKSGGVRISKSREAAEALEKFIPKMKAKKTVGQVIREAIGKTRSEKISVIEHYNEANRNLEDVLAEIYALSETGEIDSDLLDKLTAASQTGGVAGMNLLYEAYEMAKKDLAFYKGDENDI